MIGPAADLLSLVYAAFAAYTLWQLPGRWAALRDATYTDDDRNLAERIGFLLLTPIGVLVHELAHLAVARGLGARETSLSFRVYWGYVQYRPSLGATGDWLAAAAGPAASLALGLAALLIAARLRPVGRDVLLAFAHATLLLVLLLYPALSFVEGMGDFRRIYGARTPGLSLLAGVVHAAGLVAYLLLARRLMRRAGRETRAAWLAGAEGRFIALSDECLARLRQLEDDRMVRRLGPDERAELEQLRERRAWVEDHNRGVGDRAGRDP